MLNKYEKNRQTNQNLDSLNKYSKKVDDDNTFLTQGKLEDGAPCSLHDFLFPAGIVSKLCKVNDANKTIDRLPEIAKKFGFHDPTPVVYMVGAKESGRSKFYAGICRAAFRVDAVVLDSGIKSGIEQFALRRKVKVAGVFPANEVKLPKVNPTDREWNELSNGHTHLFMLQNEAYKEYSWDDEADFKMAVANQIAEGTAKHGVPKSKIVLVVMGDLEPCVKDILLAVDNNLPIILVPGSPFCDAMIQLLEQKQGKKPEDEGRDDVSTKKEINYKLPSDLEDALTSPNAHVYAMEDNNSEDIAALLHFFLTVTPY